MQAKALINHKISTTTAALLNISHTPCEQWKTLASHYSYTDLLSQYELRSCIHSEKLKDANNIILYIGIF